VRDFCGIQLCIVLHCCAKWATGIPVICIKKQKVSDCAANYEPGGREFESLRARHFIEPYQAVTSSPAAAFCFNKTSAGLLREFSPHTRFAASIKFSNSAAE
jgi:hypothetical protein